ncbi:MAG: hypothetical protein Q7R57_00220 [Dehalococcoidales bacterium]|nr:hypothetical protein [Dehalococcoidales bacterium]
MKFKTVATKTRITHVWHFARLAKSCWDFWDEYFGSRHFTKGQKFYVVYTSLDHSIPFKPDSAIDYLLINFRFMPTTIKLGDAMSREDFNKIRSIYVDISRESAVAFRQVPTIMPAFTDHNSHALRFKQGFLKPLNCSPSLHVAIPFFLYNVSSRQFPEKEPELRQYVGDIVSLVIKAKLHAMIDIAFGLYLSKGAVEGQLGLPFLDLESFFTGEQKSKDGIPYEEIYRMYREISELAARTGGGNGKLPQVMEHYFREMNLPRITREQSNCLFDVERKELVYPDELKVGGGFV